MAAEPENDKGFETLLEYLKLSRGFDFTGYKRASLVRRVAKRMEALSLTTFVDYMDYLEVHPEEFIQLFNTILINVTSFFRDESAFAYLAEEIILRILAGKQAADEVRVWVAGCASGQEAYSLAILLAEAMGLETFQRQVKIYASDVDEEALAQARAASYTRADLETVPAHLRDKYFASAGDRFVFRGDLRRAIIFGRLDLIQDAPISRLDLLVCRNTLMYFNAETQARILTRFHFALNDNGFLFLGRAEMLLTHGDQFQPLNLKHRVFTKALRSNYRDRVLIPAMLPEAGFNQSDRALRLREAAFEAAATAQLVVDQNGVVVGANKRLRTNFGLDIKDIGRPLQDLDISYRPAELRSLMEQARTERRLVKMSQVERRLPAAETQYLDIEVIPLFPNGENLVGMVITFQDVTRFQRLQSDLQSANQELETANEELQSAQEELETTNEELQSTNEELETTNEELQSTNEELETMNEELQSTNEELETINRELKDRTVELDNANAFLQSILASIESGVVVVDQQLKVLIWNHEAEDLWGLREAEVRGKPLFDLDIGLPTRDLEGALHELVDGQTPRREVVLEARNRRGRAFRCAVTCTPLRSNRDGDQTVGAVLLMGASSNHQGAAPGEPPRKD